MKMKRTEAIAYADEMIRNAQETLNVARRLRDSLLKGQTPLEAAAIDHEFQKPVGELAEHALSIFAEVNGTVRELGGDTASILRIQFSPNPALERGGPNNR